MKLPYKETAIDPSFAGDEDMAGYETTLPAMTMLSAVNLLGIDGEVDRYVGVGF